MADTTTPTTLSDEAIASIVGGYNDDPFAILGPHQVSLNGKASTAVRAFLPWAKELGVAVDGDKVYNAARVHPDGFFEAIVPRRPGFAYKLRVTDPAGNTLDLRDPYAFGPVLTDFDLHLIGEGTHYRTYEK